MSAAELVRRVASAPVGAEPSLAAQATEAAPGKAAAAAALPPPKARLRGAIHHYAAFVAVAIGIMLCLEAQSPRARIGCAIYTVR